MLASDIVEVGQELGKLVPAVDVDDQSADRNASAGKQGSPPRRSGLDEIRGLGNVI
jgi:hypothetical protein